MSCYICNSLPKRPLNIFEVDATLKKKLSEVLSEILGKQVESEKTHSNQLCRRCFNKVTDYYNSKTQLLQDFKKTLTVLNLNYESYGNTTAKPVPKKIVLPASKLQPLPDNYVVDVAKLENATKSLMSSGSAILTPSFNTPSINLKATVGSTVLTYKLRSTATTAQVKTLTSTCASMKSPISSFNVSNLPKDFLSDVSGEKNDVFSNIKIETTVNVEEDDNMEIDEDCALAVVATDESGNLILDTKSMKGKSIDLKSKSNFFDMGMLLSDPNENNASKDLLHKLQILNESNDEDDGEDTIFIAEGSDATILKRLTTGQRFLYDGKNISLVAQNDDDDLQDNVDQDSNDESQIELQVSGDEETANAIIAAAQEGGGAYIEVDSGEMFRVESVKSKTEDETNTLDNMVERVEDQFKCMICERNSTTVLLPNADTIMSHLRVQHNARAYICPVCGVVKRRRAEYTTHMETHATNKCIFGKSKQYECEICLKKYHTKMLLNEHLNVHTGAKPYTCNICNKSFASKYSHQTHLKTHSSRPRPFICENCGKSFLTQVNLTHHEKTHTGVKEFTCSVCDKAFSTQHNLEVHSIIHTGRKPYACTVCKKAFARKPEVINHMRIHTGERPFKCELCGATFSQQSNLNSHKRATHFDDRRHQCTQCPKKFKRRRLLQYHIKSAHTGERPLQCELCSASFVYPEHYKKHIRIHSGERPFSCEVCGKTFTSRENRNWHRFVHSDKKPYECLTCGAGYMRKQLLYTHMKTTGHVAESIVVNQPRVIKSTDIYDAAESLQLENNAVTDVETDLNLVQDNDDTSFLTLHNLNNFVEPLPAENKLDEQSNVLVTDKNGTMVCVFQVQLADGNTGWVAIDEATE